MGSKQLLASLIGSEVAEVSPGLAGLAAPYISQGLGLQEQGGVMDGFAGAHVAPAGPIQQYAKQMARRRFGKGHWPELKELVHRESSWNPQADNPTSSAYGLFQFLDDTWKSGYGGLHNPTSNPYKQVKAGLDYIAQRYGSPTKALNFHTNNNWY